jgi:hypothetical protein
VSGGNGIQGYGYYGVFGQSNSPSGKAGYFVGKVHITDTLFVDKSVIIAGVKNAVVTIGPDDNRLVYCEEATEVWFSDYGSEILVNGKCEVKLDPLFLRTITIDDEHPMKVFIQMNGECKGVFVKKFSDRFEVIENGDGNSNSSFDYRIIAKRKDYEDVRLEKVSIPALKK